MARQSRYDLRIKQGATHRLNIRWQEADGTPVPLERYRARMQVRYDYVDPEPLIALSTGDGITITSPGQIEIRIPATETAKLVKDRAIYDLFLEDLADPTERVSVMEGRITVTRAVTR